METGSGSRQNIWIPKPKIPESKFRTLPAPLDCRPVFGQAMPSTTRVNILQCTRSSCVTLGSDILGMSVRNICKIKTSFHPGKVLPGSRLS